MIKIRAFINGWNDRCHPFIWTKPADQVLEKIKRKKNSLTALGTGKRMACGKRADGRPSGPLRSSANRLVGLVPL